MNENINLCEILKGHEGETFYSPMYGEVKLIGTDSFIFPGNSNYPIIISRINGQDISNLCPNGHFLNEDRGECMLFPSKDQRDWNKWVEEQKPKTPKTWNDLINQHKTKSSKVEICTTFSNYIYDGTTSNTPIEKSALALLKIHQLIEVGYGGNAIKTPDNNIICIIYDFHTNMFMVNVCSSLWRSHIIFHTKEQAEEFLKYPENIQLLKDYFMI